MIAIQKFIPGFYDKLLFDKELFLWDIINNIADIIMHQIHNLESNQYSIEGNVAIHKTAIIEAGVIIKGPVVIEEGCFIGAHAYLRNGVYLGKSSSVGPACEIKSSIILDETRFAHFNFIGDSIIGRNVNFEAGSIIANHYNERTVKQITVLHESSKINTGLEKFGALVGDNCRIGANAVLSPGTLLKPGSIVKRLELVDQMS